MAVAVAISTSAAVNGTRLKVSKVDRKVIDIKRTVALFKLCMIDSLNYCLIDRMILSQSYHSIVCTSSSLNPLSQYNVA